MRSRLWASLAAGLSTALLVTGCAGDQVPGASMQAAPTATSTTTVPVDAAIEEIIAATGMTELGRRLFLSAAPTLADSVTVGERCADVGLSTEADGIHTFGCVTRGRIHLRTFGHPGASDLVYVVATHELLHIAYASLDPSERARLDQLLAGDRAGRPLLEQRLEVYASSEDDTPTEVHSLLGTEFGGLDPALEAHYGRYFDRGRVLEVFDRVLGAREAEIRALKARIAELNIELDGVQLELDALRSVGDFESYNVVVETFNALVEEHNAAIARVNALVDEDNRVTS